MTVLVTAVKLICCMLLWLQQVVMMNSRAAEAVECMTTDDNTSWPITPIHGFSLQTAPVTVIYIYCTRSVTALLQSDAYPVFCGFLFSIPVLLFYFLLLIVIASCSASNNSLKHLTYFNSVRISHHWWRLHHWCRVWSIIMLECFHCACLYCASLGFCSFLLYYVNFLVNIIYMLLPVHFIGVFSCHAKILLASSVHTLCI